MDGKTMRVVYAGEVLPEVGSQFLFLAGPSPRYREGGVGGLGWRSQALLELRRVDYRGVVYVPLTKGGEVPNKIEQIQWERRALNRSDVILFWVPRSDSLPGFTTNNEFGEWHQTGKCVLGFPKGTPGMTYLAQVALEHHVATANSLEETVQIALDLMGEGADRVGGEVEVPLLVYRTGQSQSWIGRLKGAGNRLDGANLLWLYRVGHRGVIPFAFALQVNVFVASEARNKTNEFIISRTDASQVVAVAKDGPEMMNARVVLVREFRSPGSNWDGFVHETPGGSSWKDLDPATNAADELEEETGLVIGPERLHFLAARQLAATFSTHQGHVFWVELSSEEMDQVELQRGVAFGVSDDSEQTYPEVVRARDMLGGDNVDWANVGMVMAVLGTMFDEEPASPVG